MTLVTILTTMLQDTATVDAVVGEAVSLDAFFSWENLVAFARASAMVVVGIPLILALARWVRSAVGKRHTPQQGLVAGKLVYYPAVLILLVSVLTELGFSLAPLLGAAGIVGIALGFASQTSVSNIISGFFLIAERPFQVDDIIQIGNTIGRVLSIDTLSVKLRTFQNQFVRIPNETIVKSEVTTVTRFPIRRIDVSVGIAYKENVARARDILLDVATGDPMALMEPEPRVFFDGYGESSLDLRLAVWVTRENFWDLRFSLFEEVKRRFDAEGIEIPFPHRTLYAGHATEPFPVRVVSGDAGDGDGGSPGADEADPPPDGPEAGRPGSAARRGRAPSAGGGGGPAPDGV